MRHGTAEPQTAEAEVDLRSKVETMRQTAGKLLAPHAAPDALPPTATELETLTLEVRGHLALLMPEVEEAAGRLPSESIPRYCALACIGEARQKLGEQPSPAPGGAAAHARRLARSLNALVDHYESLSGTQL
ncbi:DUF6415 family natural product biosynthesis protein [Streptomyces sp. NPDC002547]